MIGYLYARGLGMLLSNDSDDAATLRDPSELSASPASLTSYRSRRSCRPSCP
jgi:hypothetical protein